MSARPQEGRGRKKGAAAITTQPRKRRAETESEPALRARLA
jgi:hypothetical protein